MFSIWRIMNRATEILSHILEPKFSFFHRNLLEEVERESKSRSVVSNSLQTHGLYNPWNSPDQNIGVGSHSFLQGIFPPQGSNPGLWHCRQILNQMSHQESPEVKVGYMAIVHLKILRNCQTDFFFLIFKNLAVLSSLQDLSSPTRDWTFTLGTENMEFLITGPPGNFLVKFILFDKIYLYNILVYIWLIYSYHFVFPSAMNEFLLFSC